MISLIVGAGEVLAFLLIVVGCGYLLWVGVGLVERYRAGRTRRER